MFHTYEEALNWIHSRLRLGIKPGLKRMEWMLERLEHPEKIIKTVHVGGTNGKGSTVTFLRAILQEEGLKVGTFTSPYFEHFNERISVNGISIKDHDIVSLTNLIKPLSDELEMTELGAPTEFEVITAMSFYYFAQMNPVDIVLYEVGLGGRFDSTNVIEPVLSIITSIGLDHTHILGETYQEIAFEKAGIIKKNTPVLTAVKQSEAIEVIKSRAEAENAPLYQLGEQFFVEEHQSTIEGERFTYRDFTTTFKSLEISMLGKHQTENATLAVKAAQLLAVKEDSIRHGLQAAYWPGRMDIISIDPLIIIDGAHNEEGMDTLVAELCKRYKDYSIHFIFAALGDKKLDNMIRKIDRVAAQITFVDFDFPRAAKAEDLFSISNSKQKSVKKDWRKAVSEGIATIQNHEMLVITGSLYFLSEVKPFIKSL